MDRYEVVLTVYSDRGPGETLSLIQGALESDPEYSDVRITGGTLRWIGDE